MNQWKHTLAFSMVLLCFTAPGADALTQSWYSIAFDHSGRKVDITYDSRYIAETVTTSIGDGYNGTWYYYPALDRHIMWFHNGPYSANRKGIAELWTFIGAVDGTRLSRYELDMGWTTPQWVNGSKPPLPANINSQASYDLYAKVRRIDSLTGSVLREGTREGSREFTIDQYNPEWFFVSVKGQNMVLYRSLLHGNDTDDTPETQGVCCNQTTGDCYITTTGSCGLGYTYLGDNTNCASCTTQQFYADFGDAPSSYRTALANDGARHYVSTGIKLGQLISGESDGQPGQGADRDTGDDGVVFRSDLTLGQHVDVHITASTFGTINAWLDLNGDGDWDEFQEHVLIDEPVVARGASLSFLIPESAVPGSSFMRFRFNTAGGLGAHGLAADGEVEDYAVTIVDDPASGVTPLTPVHPSSGLTTHWSQPAQRINDNQPILNGWTAVSSYEQGPITADDWTLSQPIAIQGFRWWGTFDQWPLPSLPEQRPDAFHIGIWSDNAALRSPGTLLWETTCDTWHWALAGQLENGQMAFEFSAFLSQDEWFIPEGISTMTRYWVSISTVHHTPSQPAPQWQWLTTPESRATPAAMIQSVTSGTTGQGTTWPPVLGSSLLSRTYVTYPGNVGWDMAFELMRTKIGVSPGEQILGDMNGDGVLNTADVGILISLL